MVHHLILHEPLFGARFVSPVTQKLFDPAVRSDTRTRLGARPPRKLSRKIFTPCRQTARSPDVLGAASRAAFHSATSCVTFRSATSRMAFRSPAPPAAHQPHAPTAPFPRRRVQTAHIDAFELEEARLM